MTVAKQSRACKHDCNTTKPPALRNTETPCNQKPVKQSPFTPTLTHTARRNHSPSPQRVHRIVIDTYIELQHHQTCNVMDPPRNTESHTQTHSDIHGQYTHTPGSDPIDESTCRALVPTKAKSLWRYTD